MMVTKPAPWESAARDCTADAATVQVPSCRRLFAWLSKIDRSITLDRNTHSCGFTVVPRCRLVGTLWDTVDRISPRRIRLGEIRRGADHDIRGHLRMDVAEDLDISGAVKLESLALSARSRPQIVS